MVAPGYSATRTALAKQHGFRRKSAADAGPDPVGEVAPEAQTEAAPEARSPAKRRRLGISGAKQAAKAHLGGGDGIAPGEPTSEPGEA